jgi:NAD(P)-dependent dehydrogenase (short-subunit alcohol dehydrogenase family)
MSSPLRFQGQVVLVTGASRGIGRAIALGFAAEGAGVALVSTTAEGSKSVAEEIASRGGRGLPLVADVSREDEVRRMVLQAEQSLGPIDVLVNNAGIGGPTAPLASISLADWDRVLAVNLTGPFLCAREVLKSMVARACSGSVPFESRGRIVNIGSMAGKIAYPQRTPYASSKWALIGLTLSLAEEVGRLGIRVNCVCPGPIQTELLEDVFRARAVALGLSVEEVRAKYVSVTMMKRILQPGEVAETTLFLASGAASGITGQAIGVSGGWADVDRE